MSLGQVGNAPLNAIMFAAYGHATRFINDDTNGMQVISAVPYGAICVAGAWAGLLQCVVVTPTELVKCKLQVQGATSGPTRQYSGPLDCFRKVGHRAAPPPPTVASVQWHTSNVCAYVRFTAAPAVPPPPSNPSCMATDDQGAGRHARPVHRMVDHRLERRPVDSACAAGGWLRQSRVACAGCVRC